MKDLIYHKVINFINGSRIRLHVFFWVSVISGYVLVQPYLLNKLGFAFFMLLVLGKFFIVLLLVYFNLYVLLPRYLYKNRLMEYAFAIVFSNLLFALVLLSIDTYIHTSAYIGDKENLDDRLYFYTTQVVSNFWYICSTSALKFARQLLRNKLEMKQVEIEKLQTEIKYLTAQMNPHFLFNAINAIYVQVDRTNSDARETITQFSNILRYQLYECNASSVSLQKEIVYLNNYLNIQRLRKSERYKITFQYDEVPEHVEIPPLLFIGFVENAFKHVSSHKEKENFVQIELSYSPGQISFHVCNSKSTEIAETPVRHAGIGIGNIQRRLELQFKNKHHLEINNSNDKYEVNLKLLLI